MDAIEAILSRRSIRQYSKKQIDEKVLHTLLAAAMSAPSANDLQPWEFIVIKSQALLREITKFHPFAKMLDQAALAVLVCGDLRKEKHAGYLVLDCAAATQNILLAAHASGLGAVWLGIYPREERIDAVKELLHIPDEVLPVSLISLGMAAEKKECRDHFDLSRIHLDLWGKNAANVG